MSFSYVDLDIRSLIPDEWDGVSAIFVSENEGVVVYFSAHQGMGKENYVPHDFILYKSQANEDQAIGGVVLQIHKNSEEIEWQVYRSSGSFRERISREEESLYIEKLIEHLNMIIRTS